MILLAPLAKEQGGYGICRLSADGPRISFQSIRRGLSGFVGNDPGKQELLDGNPRFDQPDFRPGTHYVRMLNVTESCPRRGFRADELDAYQMDEVYWQSFWWDP